MRTIDLRSDTITHPIQAMREAMYTAPVGDDCYEEDPTINRLERYCADLFHKQAALFVCSGIMGNQLCLFSQTNRGEEIIFEEESHIYGSELGAYALLSGLSGRPIKGQKGIMPIAAIEKAAKAHSDGHTMRTGIICLENTHNFSGGNVIPLENIAAVYDLAKASHIPVHLDGARIFNAAAYLQCEVSEITQYCDTVMACFSKGLCAPIGSIIAGPKAVIEKARVMRKILGGGLRQSGILAAAALIAVQEMPGRLTEDHRRARTLGEGLQALGFAVDTDIHTNIVMAYTPSSWTMQAEEAVKRLAEHGILSHNLAPDKIRFVTHYYITDDDIAYTLDKAGKLFSKH